MNGSFGQMQNELGPILMSMWFWWVRDRYLRAARLCDVKTDMVRRLETPIPNLKGLHEVYVDLARAYQAEYLSYQMEFSFDGLTHEERLAKKWCAFFLGEAVRTVDNDRLVHCILHTCVSADGLSGQTAELVLYQYFSERIKAGFPEHIDISDAALEDHLVGLVKGEAWRLVWESEGGEIDQGEEEED